MATSHRTMLLLSPWPPPWHRQRLRTVGFVEGRHDDLRAIGQEAHDRGATRMPLSPPVPIRHLACQFGSFSIFRPPDAMVFVGRAGKP